MTTSISPLPPLQLLLLLLLLIFSQKSLSKTHPDDVIALSSFKSSILASTVHPGSCIASWDFSHDPCSESSQEKFVCGFTCDESKHRIVRLELDHPGYKGTISPEIGHLSSLQVLDLSQNSFTGSVPGEIGQLRSLQSLVLSGNRLSGSLPSALSRLAELRLLDVSRNQLYGTLPGGLFADMKNLKRLHLLQNSFKGPLPASLVKASNLRYLDASYNRFSGNSVLSSLPKSLLQISLRSNKFGGPVDVQGFEDVEVLDLSMNEFSGRLSSSLFRLQSLQQCNVSSNQLTSIEADGSSLHLTGSNLVAFDASHNKITGHLPVWFPRMSRLSALYLSNNLFTGLIPSEYAKKTAAGGGHTVGANAVLPLARLFLDGNYLQGDIPELLRKPLPNLISASFINNCLSSCSAALSFCKGGQRPQSQCQGLKQH